MHGCVERLMRQGHSEAEAIAICQKATGQSFVTGEPLKKEAAPECREGYTRINEKIDD